MGLYHRLCDICSILTVSLFVVSGVLGIPFGVLLLVNTPEYVYSPTGFATIFFMSMFLVLPILSIILMFILSFLKNDKNGFKLDIEDMIHHLGGHEEGCNIVDELNKTPIKREQCQEDNRKNVDGYKKYPSATITDGMFTKKADLTFWRNRFPAPTLSEEMPNSTTNSQSQPEIQFMTMTPEMQARQQEMTNIILNFYKNKFQEDENCPWEVLDNPSVNKKIDDEEEKSDDRIGCEESWCDQRRGGYDEVDNFWRTAANPVKIFSSSSSSLPMTTETFTTRSETVVNNDDDESGDINNSNSNISSATVTPPTSNFLKKRNRRPHRNQSAKKKGVQQGLFHNQSKRTAHYEFPSFLPSSSFNSKEVRLNDGPNKPFSISGLSNKKKETIDWDAFHAEVDLGMLKEIEENDAQEMN